MSLSEETIKENASKALGVDLAGWDRPCDCPFEGEERQEEATSSATLIGVVSNDATNPIGEVSKDGTVNLSSTNTNTTPEAGFGMLYRLVPLKLLAFLMLMSLVFALRQLVDFQRYEGIDPSDQKIAEFELLQLAEEV